MSACLPAALVTRAMHLAGAVHECGRDDVDEVLAGLTVNELRALAVCLAAMVDVEKTPTELLEWNDGPPGQVVPLPSRAASRSRVLRRMAVAQ